MLIYLCYLLLFFALLKYDAFKSIGETILAGIIFFSVFIVFTTEFLSVFKALNLLCVAISWSLFSLVCVFLILRDRQSTKVALLKIQNLAVIFQSFKWFEKLLLSTVILFLLLILFQGIIYPPNNWDSLTYHMSRIMYWLGNESVSAFPTHILRHLYQPPFTEYIILHINLMNGNDYLSNSVQWVFLVFIMVVVWQLLKLYNLPRIYKLLALFLIVTIPSVSLQASTTKNDIVCAFFVISTLYYCIKSYRDGTLLNFILLGITVGLGAFTKGTAYVFLSPILLFFGLFVMKDILFAKNYKLAGLSIMAGCIMLAINANQYARNYSVNQNILNIDDHEAESYSNPKMNGTLFLSTFLKNVGLHMGYPVNEQYDSWVKKIHQKIGVNIDSPEMNFNSLPYVGPEKISTHEDLVPNFIPLILNFLCFILVFTSAFKNFNENRSINLLALIILLQIIFFVSYLKWQPWHTRLHIPIFLLTVPLLVLVARNSKIFLYIIIFSLPFLAFNFGFNFIYNNIRPIETKVGYTKLISIKSNRFKKYFANQLYLYPEYAAVEKELYTENPKKLGFMMSDWEYPLLNSYYYDHLEIVAINVGNGTKKIIQNTHNIDAIITNGLNQSIITFDGHTYINKNPNHKYIWFYKKL